MCAQVVAFLRKSGITPSEAKGAFFPQLRGYVRESQPMHQPLVAMDVALCVYVAMMLWLTAVGFTTSGRQVGNLAMSWLGWFGLFGALDAWLGLRALGAAGPGMQGTFWILPQLLSSVCMVEFWARSRALSGWPRRAAWVYFWLLALYASAPGTVARGPLALDLGAVFRGRRRHGGLGLRGRGPAARCGRAHTWLLGPCAARPWGGWS